jgi:lysophospholipase L1-like esterase
MCYFSLWCKEILINVRLLGTDGPRRRRRPTQGASMAKRPQAKTAAAREARVHEAAKRGRSLAAQVIRRRAAARRMRQAATARSVRRAPLRATAEIPSRTRRALALPPPAGLLIAEGDSWFDYPLNDVLSMLEDVHGFEVESVAHRGDTVEDMAYAAGQFDNFSRALEKLLRRDRVPQAILLSGGGNDIAGDEFAILLNHVLSGLPPINEDIVRGVVDVRLRNAYAFLISGLTEITRRYLDRPIPILVHGYDYPVPDGRGFLGGWAFLPGPWLQPGLHRKGHERLATNKSIIRALIDSFNQMLQQVSAMAAFEHVRYVDLRNTLSQGTEYKRDWANELHPTKKGFRAVAARIAREI